MNTPDPKVIVALDFPSAQEAMNLVEQLDPGMCKLKVGKELFTREGPGFVRSLVDRKFKVFLDLKFHDIPNTTAKAVGAAADLGVWMVNVHASGGKGMMEAAIKELRLAGSDTLLIAVTVLTSMSEEQLHEVGCGSSLPQQVLRLAKLAYSSGLHGVVCSAHEAQSIATQTDQAFLRVTPGIRPSSSAVNDQHRIMTPVTAIANGSSYLVIGRPITQADKPHEALLAIGREIGDY